MNDTPEPQLKPLLDGSGNSVRQSGNERMGLTPKLVMATAIIAACMGGAMWHRSAPGTSSSAAGAQTIQTASPSQIRSEAAHFDAQLALIPTDRAESALAETGFDKQQRTEIVAAVRNKRMRLVRMPIAQVSGALGQSVAITSGSMTQNLLLKPELQTVVVPIYMAGEITINPLSTPAAGGLESGILTTLGPLILPRLTNINQQIVLDVIVQ